MEVLISECLCGVCGSYLLKIVRFSFWMFSVFGLLVVLGMMLMLVGCRLCLWMWVRVW